MTLYNFDSLPKLSATRHRHLYHAEHGLSHFKKSCAMYSDGERWESQRKPMSKFMMVPRKLGEYHEAFNEVSLDLVNLLKLERGEDNIYCDVLSVLRRWSFECKW